jgi:hypothetical protein
LLLLVLVLVLLPEQRASPCCWQLLHPLLAPAAMPQLLPAAGQQRWCWCPSLLPDAAWLPAQGHLTQSLSCCCCCHCAWSRGGGCLLLLLLLLGVAQAVALLEQPALPPALEAAEVLLQGLLQAQAPHARLLQAPPALAPLALHLLTAAAGGSGAACPATPAPGPWRCRRWRQPPRCRSSWH